MPGSTIDTLFTSVQPTRSAEPTLREPARVPFAPALREAVDAQSPRTTPPKPAPRESATDDSQDRATSGDDNYDNSVEQPIAGDDEQGPAAVADAVEISEDAASAASAEAYPLDDQQATLQMEESALEVIHVQGGSKPLNEADETNVSMPPHRKAARNANGPVTVQNSNPTGQSADAGNQTTQSLRTDGHEVSATPKGNAPLNEAAETASDDKANSVAADNAPSSEHAFNRDSANDGPRQCRSRDDAPAVVTASGPGSLVTPVGIAIPPEAAATTVVAAVENLPTPVVEAPAATSSSPTASATADRLAVGRSLLNASPTPGDHEAAPSIDRSRFVQRVEGAMRKAAERDGRVQVRLAPPELGSLRIELTLQNGVMSARLEAETAAAKNVLLDNLPALRERLAQQDIRVERFDVDVRRDWSGHNGNGPHDRPESQPTPGRSRLLAAATSNAESRPNGPEASSGTSTASNLDVRI